MGRGAKVDRTWWAEAGVDVFVGERPGSWLVAPAPKPDRDAASTVDHQPEVATRRLPETLEAFDIWVAASPPRDGEIGPVVGPQGLGGAPLMVLVDMPSAEDAANKRLLSGEAGDLFDRMLAAIGLSRAQIRLGSLSSTRSAGGSLDAAARARLAPIARHHIALAEPEVVLLFGDACALALLGGGVAETRGKWHEITTDKGNVKALVTIRPENLLAQPRLKKLAWEDLQKLSGDKAK